jgi:hypothetical protein
MSGQFENTSTNSIGPEINNHIKLIYYLVKWSLSQVKLNHWERTLKRLVKEITEKEGLFTLPSYMSLNVDGLYMM